VKSREYQEGFAELKRKKHPAIPLIEEIEAMSPALAEVIVAHGVGEIWGKMTPHLSKIEKEIASFAVLIDQGALQEVKAHAFTCLKLGFTKEQLLELLVFLTLYCGVPKIVIAFSVVKEAILDFEREAKS
jgi:alkylhydroperoxidase/carboxymuconolactone decarboxylase family protein YurZ